MNYSDWEAHIDRIISSKGFGRSKTYARLLTYIVRSSLNGHIPKETSIAIEVFGKDPSFNPAEDTLVRVYMHNLRKKLSHYYKNEGKEETFRIEVPKGKYEAIFLENTSPHQANDTSRSFRYTWPVWILGVLVIASIVINLWLLNEAQTKGRSLPQWSQSAIWSPILDATSPTAIVLGDIFLYEEYDSLISRSRMIRDAQINAEQELQNYVASHPAMQSRTVYPAENPLLTKSQVFSLQSLIPLMESGKGEYTLRIMSRMTSEELHGRHIVFLGLYKTLGLLQYVFDASHLELAPSYTQLIDTKTGDTLYQDGNPLTHHTDYGYLGKFKGPDGHTMLIISSFTDTGMLQVVNHLTQMTLLEELENTLRQEFDLIPNEWEVLFEVGGYDRVNLEAGSVRVYSR